MNGLSADAAYALVLVAFFGTLALMPPGIAWLRRLSFGQHVRDDGPQSHQSKEGTPTLGGILFLPVIIVLGLAADYLAHEQMPRQMVLLAGFTAAGMLIGWLDDYRSIRRGKSLGLRAREKFALQFIACGAFVWLSATWGARPFTLESSLLTPGTPAVVLALLAVLAVWIINAANISDGLDGLAGSQAIVAIAAVYFFGAGAAQVQLMPLAAVAALLAFLCFNCPPARVFMGDTGSMGLGCLVVGLGLSGPLWILVAATAVWSLEALSVVIQVLYFKATGGKRIFRMAPLHHHFELCGWPETTVTARFIVASIVLGLLGPMLYLLWGAAR